MNIGDIALAYWRLDKWVAEANVERKTAATSSLRQMKKYLDENNVELKDYLGERYDCGFAIDVVGRTTEKNITEDKLIISETLVPLILKDGDILKYGQVMLGEEVKMVSANNELPPDPIKAITILNHNITQYCTSNYKDMKIVRKLRKCREKLNKQLRNLTAGETSYEKSTIN